MSVPRRGKRERNRAKMRERILTAVREMVLQLGTTDFTMAELAEAASVSLVTPYNYFGSKAGPKRRRPPYKGSLRSPHRGPLPSPVPI